MRILNKIIMALVLTVLVSCGGGPTQQRAVMVGQGLGPKFGDSAPHPWVGGHPYDHPVHGIDVSRWQATIDWTQVRNSGVSFAFIKATEGGDLADPNFRSYWYESGLARIPRGAYHFYYFCRTGAEQARWFMQHVPRERGAMPPVLDLEWTNSRNCPRRPPPDEVRREARIFMDLLHRHYGQRPIIYTTVDFYRENGLGSWNEEMWLRSVAGHPRVVYPGQAYSFWQYTGTGIVPGIRGNTDLNVFAGTVAEWRRWLNRRLQ